MGSHKKMFNLFFWEKQGLRLPPHRILSQGILLGRVDVFAFILLAFTRVASALCALPRRWRLGLPLWLFRAVSRALARIPLMDLILLLHGAGHKPGNAPQPGQHVGSETLGTNLIPMFMLLLSSVAPPNKLFLS